MTMTRARASVGLHLLWRMLLSLAPVLLLAGCPRGDAKGLPEQPPLDEIWLREDQIRKGDIRVADAEERELTQPITAGGRIAFHDLHVTHVFSPVTGRVLRVLAQPGQMVKKGTPLLTLASPDVGQVFADLLKAEAEQAAAQAEFQRQQRLAAARASSQRELEAAEDAFRTARAESQRAQKRARTLRAGGADSVTQEYTLRSFIDGEVIARAASPGAEVQGQYAGGAAAELYTIGDIKAVWAFADVADVDLPAVRPGAAVDVRVVAYPDRIFHGQVDWVSDTVDPSLRTGRVRCALANADEALKPEMLATLAIARPARRLLVVPRDAVARINESTFVFVADGVRPDGRRAFQRRPVRAGDEQDGLVPIFEGLHAGERVVSDGSLTHAQLNDEVWPTEGQLRAAGITVAAVRVQEVDSTVSIGGRLAFDDLRVSHVFSPVGGRVTRVLATLGQRVVKGTPLLAISSPDVGQAGADAVKAEAALTAAEHEARRQRDLYSYAAPVRAGTKRDLEAAESALAKAKAELGRARQKTRLLGTASVDTVTQEYILRSPIAGEVIARAASPGLEVQGQYAGGGNVTELYTVGALDRLLLFGDVHEMDRPRVTEGDAVALRVGAYPDRVFQGTVDWVSDVLDPVLHTARVRCLIDNRDRLLRPEMYERLRITLPGRPTLAIPRRALLRNGTETMVFVAGNRRPDGAQEFKRRQVSANEAVDGDLIPVFSGLRAGESVAVDHAVLLLGML